MISLGGNVCVRNGNSLDYCWRESVKSLLPICDSVVVCDGESDDGTQDEIRTWSETEPKIKLCVYSWPNPCGDVDFWVKWLNYAREHLGTDYHIQLDADEVLSERSYPIISELMRRAESERLSVWCTRYNFWRDAQHLVPHGVCCGHKVVRIAPQSVWLPSDGPHPRGAQAVQLAIDSQVEIFHYGFLRERSAFFKKAKSLHSYFFNTYDSRLVAAEERTRILVAENKPGNWMDHCDMEWIDKLIPYHGPHPAIMESWFGKRGLTFV